MCYWVIGNYYALVEQAKESCKSNSYNEYLGEVSGVLLGYWQLLCTSRAS